MESIITQQLMKMQGEILGKIRKNGLQDIGRTAEELFRVVKTETYELLEAILEVIDKEIANAKGQRTDSQGAQCEAQAANLVGGTGIRAYLL